MVGVVGRESESDNAVLFFCYGDQAGVGETSIR